MQVLRVIVALVFVLLVVAGLGGVKALQIQEMIGADYTMPPTAVVIDEARAESWDATLPAIGSVAAIDGTVVRAEIAGTIERIAFEPGARVERGALLVALDRSIEAANLEQAKADAALWGRRTDRARELFDAKTIPAADLDTAQSSLAAAQARVASLSATLDKKTIRAPFAGELGIKRISRGQYLQPGDAIVTLQALERVFVEFTLPQRELGRLAVGMPVRASSDAWPERRFDGTIAAIEPTLDAATRSVRVQATFDNAERRLRPGMFVSTDVVLPDRVEAVVVPSTAVVYASYGDSIFTVADDETVTRRIVRLGRKRGDFVQVLSGIEAGTRIVAVGGYKLQNGETVVHSELGTVAPSERPTPDDS